MAQSVSKANQSSAGVQASRWREAKAVGISVSHQGLHELNAETKFSTSGFGVQTAQKMARPPGRKEHAVGQNAQKARDLV